MNRNNGSKTTQVIVNVFRPSRANPSDTMLYGLSSKYRIEEWTLEYYSVEKDSSILPRKVTCCLPEGYEEAYRKHGDRTSTSGPIYKVRAWRIEFTCYFLDFCPDYLKVRDEHAQTAGDKARWDLNAIGWDLPGHLIIASKEHPLLAEGPSGRKYVYDYWCIIGMR